jgi:cytochrome c oxidase cbb3-type subunit 3
MKCLQGRPRATASVASVVLACAWLSSLTQAQAPPGGAPGTPPQRPTGESPASGPRISTQTPQQYLDAEIQAGQSVFASRCAFCHGRDAQGGENGPDLTRSLLVADDVRGDQLGPMIRAGRPEKGMPAFPLSDPEMAAAIAFIHDSKSKADATGGGRRTVEVDDLQTGDAEAGRRYFDGEGGCATCHSLEDDFLTVAARYEGLALLQRMLYPGGGRGTAKPATPPTVTITTRTGQSVTGTLTYRDEFTISVIGPDGWPRSWPLDTVTISGGDPLRAHVDQLSKYTDRHIHNVLAYLQTLR